MAEGDCRPSRTDLNCNEMQKTGGRTPKTLSPTTRFGRLSSGISVYYKVGCDTLQRRHSVTPKAEFSEFELPVSSERVGLSRGGISIEGNVKWPIETRLIWILILTKSRWPDYKLE